MVAQPLTYTSPRLTASPVAILHGDCLAVLKEMPDCFVDAIVTDPPAGIAFMGKNWDNPDYFPISDLRGSRKTGNGNVTSANGFAQGVQFDSSKKGRDAFISFMTEVFTEALRVIRPGGHAFVWALPRTSHWTATALEDAGWEIRDVITHLFGCLSEDTEILTEHGWEQYHKCVVGSLALCYNVNTQQFGWEPIQEVLTYDYNDTAFRIYSDNTDQIVSRNHRCLVERSGGYVFNEAESLECYERVPILENLSGLLEALPLHGQGRGRETGDLLSTLQGQIRPDGTSKEGSSQAPRQHKIPSSPNQGMHSVRQSVHMHNTVSGTTKQDMLERVCKQVSGEQECTPTQTRPYGNMPAMREAIQACEWEKDSQVLQLHVRGSAPYLQSSVCGTSTEDSQQGQGGVDRKGARVSQAAYDGRKQSRMEGRRDILQEARQLHQREVCTVSGGVHQHGTQGWLRDGTSANSSASNRQTVTEDRGSTSHQPRSEGQPDREPATLCEQSGSQTARASGYTRSDLAIVEPVHYQGIVWCVRVPSGAFVARRNGKIFVTGNSGFPKSHNISAAIDKLQGAEREVIGKYDSRSAYDGHERTSNGKYEKFITGDKTYGEIDITAPATPEAARFAGYGSALKPSNEHWILCRKPLSEPTIAQNVLRWNGCGGLNIDATRIAGNVPQVTQGGNRQSGFHMAEHQSQPHNLGRFPSNTLFSHTLYCRQTGVKRVRGTAPPGRPSREQAKEAHNPSSYGFATNTPFMTYTDPDGYEQVDAWECDPSCPVRILGEQSGVRGNNYRPHGMHGKGHSMKSMFFESENVNPGNVGHNDEGTAARYFAQFSPSPDELEVPFIYCSKASKRDRSSNGTVENTHPTCKNTSLMKYLCRLVGVPGGVILDPFMGSGSTGVAALQEGFSFIGIEQSEEYCTIARSRIAHALQDAGIAEVQGDGEWICSDDCPVAALDRQSGIRKSVAGIGTHKAGKQGYHGNVRDFQTTNYGDTGGASRFFAQFAPDGLWSEIEMEATHGDD